MRGIYWMTLSFFFFSSAFYLSAQFTEKRIKRGPSMGSLRESCCKLFGQVLQGSAHLFCAMGSIQKKALASIEGYVNGDKESWCETASKQKLITCKEKFSQLQEKIDALVHECDDVMLALSGP